MDQGGFDFQRPSERREAKRFEPPPWEREAFEEMRRQRELDEQDEANVVEGELQPEAVRLPEQGVADLSAVPEVVTQAPAVAAEAVEAEVGPEAAKVDEARMIEMLAGLSAEHPPATTAVRSLSIVSGAGLAVLGLGLAVWGGSAAARAQGSGRLLALVLVVMGLAYLAVGLGLVYRALKQRGVL